jgi:hypothetical protein
VRKTPRLEKLIERQTPIATEEARTIVWIILPRLPIARGECRVCGCTDDRACIDGCSWVDANRTLCTACCPPPPVTPKKPRKGRAK